MNGLTQAQPTILEALLVALVAFVLTLALTRPLIGWLKTREFGKAIRVDGPDHAEKAGTPTMGGLVMLGVIALVAAYLAWRFDTAWPLQVAMAMALFGVLGMVDDLHGLARRAGAEIGVGLTARRMFVLQVVAALSVVALLMSTTWSSVWLGVLRGEWFYVVLSAGSVIAIVGTVNGLNMSDGLDGLASGLAAAAFAAYGVVYAFITVAGRGTQFEQPVQTEWALFVLTISIAAACLGFLVFNRHPARVFMGNVTSMALGAGLVMIALGLGASGLKLLPVIGFVFVVEVVSVLLQVTYFKATGGRRIFRMAPIHHHFEAKGWSERKVVHRFWLLGLASAAAGVGLTIYAFSGGPIPFFP